MDEKLKVWEGLIRFLHYEADNSTRFNKLEIFLNNFNYFVEDIVGLYA